MGKNKEVTPEERLQAMALSYGLRLDAGRHYLMGVEPEDLTVADALEAFGFARDGLHDQKKYKF